jgi:hypothetical protein
MFSVQWIQTQKDLSSFFYLTKYPYIFDLGNGRDLIADSQQASTHPLYFIINFFLNNKILLQSYFIKIHMFFFIVGIFIFTKNKIKNIFLQLILVLSASNSVSLTQNIAHPFLICSISYFPWLIYLIEKIFLKNKKKYYFYFTILTSLLIYVGHFQYQFIFFCSLFIYLLCKYISQKETITIIKILFSIAFAFIISLPQLLPVFDLLRESTRSSAGSFSMFDQSSTPLQLLGYFFPAINFILYKNFNDLFTFYGGSSLVEGVHYIGIIMLSLFFYLVNKMKNLYWKDGFGIIIFYLILRSFGIFFIINIFLNYLPFFGQFRSPVRNLHLVDFFIFIFIAINLSKYFVLHEYQTFLIKFSKLIIFLTIFTIIIIFLLEIDNLLFQDYFMLSLQGILCLLILFSIYFLKKKFFFFIILILCFFDLILMKIYTPLHVQILQKKKWEQDQKFFNANFCRNEDKIIAIFDHQKIKNDLPRFNDGKYEDNFFRIKKLDKNNEITSNINYIIPTDCKISFGTYLSALDSVGAKKFDSLVINNENFSDNEKKYLSSFLGFNNYILISYNNQIFLSNSIILNEFKKKELQNFLYENFLNKKTNNSEKIYPSLVNKKLFSILDKLNMLNFLSSKELDSKFIKKKIILPHGGNKNFIVLDNNKNIVNFLDSDPFLEILSPSSSSTTFTIFYIPTYFLVGVSLIIPSIIILIITRKLFFNFFPKNITNNINFILPKMFLSNLFNKFFQKNIFFYFFLFIIFLCCYYLYIVNSYTLSSNSYQFNIMYISLFYILIFLIIFFTFFTILNFKYKNFIWKNVFCFGLANLLAGMVLYGEYVWFPGPEALKYYFHLGSNDIVILKKILFIFN